MKRKNVLFFTVVLALVLGSCPSPNTEIDPNILFVPPEMPSLVPGDCKIEVRFTAVANATKYELWYGESEDINLASGRVQDIVTTNQLVSAVITGLQNGKIYYVWSRAWFSSNVSEFSEVASIAPLPPPPATGSPTLLSDDESLDLSWSAVAEAEAYTVYYTSKAIATPDSGTASFEVNGTATLIFNLTNGTPYYVWVTAKNSAGESPFSTRATETPTASTTAPAAPLQPTLIYGDERLTAVWTAVKRAKSYSLFYGLTSNFSDAKEWSEKVSVTEPRTARITGLSNEKGYYVWIKAENAKGLSPQSPPGYEITHGKQPINLENPYFKVGVAASRFPNEEGGKGDRLSRKQETGLADLVADSMAWWGRKHYAGTIDFAFVNGGLITNALPKGDITVGGLDSILWRDPMSILTLKGSEVIKLFEYVATIRHNGGGGSGTGAWGQVSKEVRYTINYTYGGDPTTGDLEGLTIHGLPVDPLKDYRFVTSTYLVDGGDGYGAYLLTNLRQDSGILIVNSVAEYVYDQDNVPIEPITDGRITLIGAVWSN
jgi:hypothetical protein